MKIFHFLLYSFFTLSTSPGYASPVKSDEQIIFFPAEAYQVPGTKNWGIHFHGWIYEPEIFGEINGVLRKAFGLPPEDSEEEKSIFRNRAHWFVVDNERGKRITVQLGKQQYRLARSSANGHFHSIVKVSPQTIQSLRLQYKNQVFPFRAILREKDKRLFQGEIHLIPEQGISVISDIDDTIKISDVTNKKELLANTFMRPFRPVPGMEKIYRDWQMNLDAKFHYVSASPWQLYPALSEFLKQYGFPPGIFHMKTFRFKDSSFFNLFSDPVAYKTKSIESIFTRYPKRKFILVGDTGEKDPEVYAGIARKHPAQVAGIFIHKVVSGNDSQRFTNAFQGLPDNLWFVFERVDDLSRRLLIQKMVVR